MNRLLIIASFTALMMGSCVPARLHNELKAKSNACATENDSLKASNMSLQTKLAELQAALNDLKARAGRLMEDTASSGSELRSLRESSEKLRTAYETLLREGPQSTANAEATRTLIRDLQRTQEELQRKEDELDTKEKLLRTRQDSLARMSNDLRAKNKRLTELEEMLAAKDSAVRALRNSVSAALLGYKDKGLSVEMKNGKVYVMMEERLLFASGSTVVDAKGVDALRDLGKVLEKNNDISILIEGHTDNVPMNGSGEIRDNWDLSVMRATSVVKILLANSKINPLRLTAAGRGEHLPLDKANTADARKKNRRIEVILTPRLDDILKLLETN
jgi:chemotaxis protein MotB